jgi:WD40 repeat protein
MSENIKRRRIVVGDFACIRRECDKLVLAQVCRFSFAALLAFCSVGGLSRTGFGEDQINGQTARLSLQFNSGHARQVVKVSNDLGRSRFASVGYEGSVKLWDSKSGRLIASTPELYQFPLALTLASDGEHLAISSRDGDITLLTIRGLQRESVIHVPRFQRAMGGMSLPNGIRAVAISPDLKQVALGLEDGQIVLYDLKSKSEIGRLTFHQGMVTDLQADDSWSHLASWAQDGKLQIWDISNRTRLVSIETQGYAELMSLRGFGFSADDGSLYVSAGHVVRAVAIPPTSSTLELMQLKDLRKTALSWCGPTTRALTQPVVNALVANGTTDSVLVGCSDGQVRMADTKTGWQPVVGVQDKDLQTVAFDASGKRLFVTTYNSNAGSMWSTSTGERIAHWTADQGTFQLTAQGVMHSEFDVWGPGTLIKNESNPTDQEHHVETQGATTFSPDGHKCAVVSIDNRISLYTTDEGKPMWQQSAADLQLHGVARDPIFSADGTKLVLQDVYPASNAVITDAVILDVGNGKRLGLVRSIGNFVLAIDPSGTHLVVDRLELNGTHSLVSYNIVTGIAERTYDGAKDEIRAVAFDSTGKLLASGEEHGEIRIWDSKLPSALRSFPGNETRIISIAISPNEQTVASAGEDGNVVVSSIDGRRLLTVTQLDETNNWLAYTDDGLFDGTPKAMNEISWKFKDRPIETSLPLDAFFVDFFRPSLMAEIFSGKRPIPSVDLGVAAQVPGIRSLLNSNEVVLREETGGVAVCFKEVPNIAMELPAGERPIAYQSPSGYEVNPSDKTCPYRKQIDLDGENPSEFLRRAATWTKEPFRTQWDGRLSAVASSDLYIQTVAIGDYSAESEYSQLPYAVPSATGIREHFAGLKQANSSNFFRSITVLDPLEDNGASAESIEARFSQLATRVRPEDVVILYFVGHGEVSPNGEMFYFIPSGTKASERQEISHSMLSSAMLADMLRAIPARRILFIMDACQSGGAVESLGKVAEARARLAEQSASTSDSAGIGIHIMAATMPLNFAAGAPGRNLSLLAATILDTLGKSHGTLTTKSLEADVARQLPLSSMQITSYRQVPLIEAIGLDFPLSK